MTNFFHYSGTELFVFEKATNWKRYYLDLCKSYFYNNSNILEVGAGIGGLTKLFASYLPFKTWSIIEPDKDNFEILKDSLDIQFINKKLYYYNDQIKSFLDNNKQNYDIIFMADVLEHIENDSEIISKLINILNDDGKLIIFVPAHQFLFSEFDEKIGHFRRYSKNTLARLFPKDVFIQKMMYIDSFSKSFIIIYFNTFIV